MEKWRVRFRKVDEIGYETIVAEYDDLRTLKEGIERFQQRGYVATSCEKVDDSQALYDVRGEVTWGD